MTGIYDPGGPAHQIEHVAQTKYACMHAASPLEIERLLFSARYKQRGEPTVAQSLTFTS
jgi:hypothetical protein